MIAAAGGIPIRLPVLEIEPHPYPAEVANLVDRLDDFAIAIFVSANAVRFGMDAVRARGQWPERLIVGAVGRATARALQEAEVRVDLVPESDFSSEGLLALPQLQSVGGKSVVIFRGAGGREALANELQLRGARVEYAQVYARRRPRENLAALLSSTQREAVDIVVVTSNEALENLVAMAEPAMKDWLLNKPLVVVSHRAVELAARLGFGRPVLCSTSASDEAVVAALQNWREGNSQSRGQQRQ
jgi:uroporphyrinogen-III synthase